MMKKKYPTLIIVASLGPYSQHFIFVTYESAQKALVLHNAMVESLANDEHSNLLVLFISYKIKEVL